MDSFDLTFLNSFFPDSIELYQTVNFKNFPIKLSTLILPQSRAEQSKAVNLEWYYYRKTTTTPHHTTTTPHSLNYLELFNTMSTIPYDAVRRCTRSLAGEILSHLHVRQRTESPILTISEEF